MFKITFIRVIINEIKKTLLIIIITRILSMIEATFILTIKSK